MSGSTRAALAGAVTAMVLGQAGAASAERPARVDMPEPVVAVASRSVPIQQDDVRARAVLRSEEVRVGETAVLEIVVETGGAAVDGIELPSLPSGLSLAGSRDYSQLQFSLPGGRSRSLRREFLINPRAPGTYEIPSATIRVRGATYRTVPLRLHVLPAARASHGAATSDEYVRLRAWVEPADTVFVGQQLTYRLEALYSEPAQVRNHRTLRYGLPRPSGFWLQDLPDQPYPETRVVDGRPMEVQRADLALFPIEPGTFHVPPGTLRYDVRRGFLQAAESRELATDSVRIVVVPLPQADQPATFDGAVGRFRLDARIEPARVPAGEAAVLVVDIEGTGNLRALPPPRTPQVPGLEVYAPAEETDVTVRDGVVGGVKRFSWVLVPSRTGEFEVPAIEYAYFDPESVGYDVATTPSLVLTADEGGVAGGDADVRIRAPKQSPADRPLRWVDTPGFLLLQFVPLAALGWVLIGRRRRGQRRPSRRELLRRLHAELDRMDERARSEPRVTADDLAHFIPAWTADRLGLPTLRLDDLEPALIDAGASRGTARSLAMLMERLDRLRYAPAPPSAVQIGALVREARGLLELADTQTAPPRAASAAAGATVASLLLFVGCTAGVDPVGDAELAFRDAVAAYDAGNHVGAIDGFRAVVNNRPSDGHAWYNLGNAHYTAGQNGYAVWAWSVAAGLMPRDADVRENLRRVAPSGAAPRGAGLPLTREEVLLILALGWWIGAAGLALYLRSGRPDRLKAGAAGLLVAVVVFVAWAAPRAGDPAAIVLEGDTALHVAPAQRSEVRTHVAAGTDVDILEIRDEWARVRASGTEGWLLVNGLGRL